MTYFIYTFTGALSVYFFCIHLLPIKLTIIKRLTIFLYTFGTAFLFNRIYGQASTFITFLGLTLLTYFFTDDRYLSLCCYLFGYLHGISSSYLFMWIMAFFLKIDMNDFSTNSKSIMLFACIYCLYCAATTKLIGWYLHKKLKLSQYLTNRHLLKAIFIDLLLLMLFYIFNFSYGERLGYNYGVIALNGLIFIFLFIITVFLMYSVYKITMSEQSYKHRMAQFENLRTYTERLENSYGIMRKFKHDYMNILITMSGYMKENDMESLKEYYGEKILPISRAFTESDTKLGNLSNIKNTALKSLLSSKFVYMMELGIKTEIELTEPINGLNIDCLDLSRIIGIFLDNAMEAAMETEAKKVHFCMFYKGMDLYLIVQNTALPLTHTISELRSHDISTKGSNRGIGLFNVEVILKNYENAIWNTTYEEPFFTQELILIHTGT
ncbi:GHKL domain-containing protein [Lacrimispora sp.]|uniref:GHKL domain-containing protein n=1 Tax=Lacrimispora sp. TaxID=2719234 RepID=UPI00289809C9|nr:GHKL domain-containing protein [Lacrimispora sp.]